MLKTRLLALVLATAPLAAQAGLFNDDQARKQISELQQTVTQQQKKNEQQDQQLTEKISSVETAVKELKLTEILNQLESLRTEMAALRGQLEVQAYQVDQLQKRQKDLYNDIDTRVRALETSTTATPEAKETKNTAEKDQGEESAYASALDTYKQGNYAAAASAFQAFSSKFPSSKLAPNALYWTAAAQSAQKDCIAASVSHKKLLAQYPDSNKAPEALLGLANCQLELKETASAKKTLQQLVTRYPATPAGEQGKKQLAQLPKK